MLFVPLRTPRPTSELPQNRFRDRAFSPLVYNLYLPTAVPLRKTESSALDTSDLSPLPNFTEAPDEAFCVEFFFLMLDGYPPAGKDFPLEVPPFSSPIRLRSYVVTFSSTPMDPNEVSTSRIVFQQMATSFEGKARGPRSLMTSMSSPRLSDYSFFAGDEVAESSKVWSTLRETYLRTSLQ